MKTVFLNRSRAAKYVRERCGLPCSEKFLAKLEIIGGGPRCVKDDDSVWYTPSTLNAWLSALLDQPLALLSDPKAKATSAPSPNVLPIKIYDIHETNLGPGYCHSGMGSE